MYGPENVFHSIDHQCTTLCNAILNKALSIVYTGPDIIYHRGWRTGVLRVVLRAHRIFSRTSIGGGGVKKRTPKKECCFSNLVTMG